MRFWLGLFSALYIPFFMWFKVTKAGKPHNGNLKVLFVAIIDALVTTAIWGLK